MGQMNTALMRVETLIAKLYEGAWCDAPPGRPFGRMQLVGTPEEAAALLADDETFAKDYDLLVELGHSRFDARGQDWMDRRDLTQPILRDAALKRNHDDIQARYGGRFEHLRQRSLSARMVVSGARIEQEAMAAAAEVFVAAFGGATAGELLADWIFQLRPTARVAQQVAMFGAYPDELAALRREVAVARARIVAMLAHDPPFSAWCEGMNARMQSVPADPSRTPFDALSELIVALLAGTETTMAAFSWTLVALAEHPRAQSRIAEEVREMGAASRALEVMVQETMRYVPPVPLLTRRVTREGAELAGRQVANGTLLALDVIRLHHDRGLWDRPGQFQPEREAFLERSYHKRAYLPFSAGSRVCGGTGLARAELHCAIAALLSRFRIATDRKKGAIEMEYALTLRPRSLSGLWLEPRDG